jgi:hypothetical protein
MCSSGYSQISFEFFGFWPKAFGCLIMIYRLVSVATPQNNPYNVCKLSCAPSSRIFNEESDSGLQYYFLKGPLVYVWNNDEITSIHACQISMSFVIDPEIFT